MTVSKCDDRSTTRTRFPLRWARGLADYIRGAVRRRRPLAGREVIYDDGWTRTYAPRSDGWCEIEFIRIPWVEAAKAKQGAERLARDAPQVRPLAAPTSGRLAARVSAPVKRRRPEPVRASQVVGRDGASQCAADVLTDACRCGAHGRLASHGSTADTLNDSCPDCFSIQ